MHEGRHHNQYLRCIDGLFFNCWRAPPSTARPGRRTSTCPSETAPWLKKELAASDAAWKICCFHHPLFSDSKTHGSDTGLRKVIEPIFKEYGGRAVFSGHDHTYERLKSRQGVYHFVLGNSGQLRVHNLRKSPDTERGFDTDRSFGLVEIAGGELYFQIVSRTGETIDSGMYPLAAFEKAKAA